MINNRISVRRILPFYIDLITVLFVVFGSKIPNSMNIFLAPFFFARRLSFHYVPFIRIYISIYFSVVSDSMINLLLDLNTCYYPMVAQNALYHFAFL